jgi:mono/diheme cytochrome c family protein
MVKSSSNSGMLTLCVLFFISTIVFLVATERNRLSKENKKYTSKRIEYGASLYSQHCSSCHGLKGEGVGQLGPPLNDAKFFTTRTTEVGWLGTLQEYVSSTISYGRMIATRPIYAGNGSTYVMPPWGDTSGGLLQPADIYALTLYTLNWQPTALGKVEIEELPLPTFKANSPENIEKGKTVFIDHCGQCHGFRSITLPNLSAPDLSLISREAGGRKEELDGKDYIQESVLVPSAHLAEGFNETSCNAVLTISELEAVTTFLLQAQ